MTTACARYVARQMALRLSIGLCLAWGAGCAQKVPEAEAFADANSASSAADGAIGVDASAGQGSDTNDAGNPGDQTPATLLLTLDGAKEVDQQLKGHDGAFFAITVQGPGVPLVAGGGSDATQVVVPFSEGTRPDAWKLAVPPGDARTVRVDLFSMDINGQPAYPIIASGRSLAATVLPGVEWPVTVYLLPSNMFVPARSSDSIEVDLDHRAGLSAVASLDSVLIIGGAKPKSGANAPPLDPQSYGALQSNVMRYDVGKRVLTGPVAKLSQGRAFAASAAGVGGLVAVAGGYIAGADDLVPTGLIEYYDPVGKGVKVAVAPSGSSASAFKPHLNFARAHHSITQLFAGDDYFLIAGGKGAAEASATWEIWHPEQGTIATGPLTKARWNHAAVGVREGTGGRVMLIGGENENGPIADIESIGYDNGGHVAFKGNALITCHVGAKFAQDDGCAALKQQIGYEETAWEPVVQSLPGGVGRTMVGAAYSVHADDPLGPRRVHVIGGFLDALHSKVSGAIDVLDIATGKWVVHTEKLETPRGAPLVAPIDGLQDFGVLIVGGVDAKGETVAAAEVLWTKNDGSFKRVAALNTDSPARVLGAAVPLTSGALLIAGGVTATGSTLKFNAAVHLFSP